VAATEYRAADIRDAATLGAIVAEVRPDVIFHVAAQRDPGLAEAEVHRTITTNVFGTRNVLAAARAAGTPQVVYASTGKALRPYSPETYTASKRAAEWLVASGGGLLTSASRFTHVVDNSIVYQRLLAWAAPGCTTRTSRSTCSRPASRPSCCWPPTSAPGRASSGSTRSATWACR
jgi:hypothetical protein